MSRGASRATKRRPVKAAARRVRAATVPTQSSPYAGGSDGRRLRSLYAPAHGPTSAVTVSLDTLRRRCRALARDNAWARNGLEVLTGCLVGTGVTPRPRFADKAWQDRALEAYEDWSRESDPTGMGLDWTTGAQPLAMRGCIEGGEVFIRRRDRRPADGLRVPFQLQLLEAEYVPTWKTETLRDGGWIQHGVEFSPIGKVRAYHMHRAHPGEHSPVGMGGTDLVRVPADQVIHLFRPLRPGQVRGEPWQSPVILPCNDLADYQDAERVRKRGAASYGGVITSPQPELAAAKLGQDATSASGVTEVTQEPGVYIALAPGEEVTPFPTADVGPNYGAFLTWGMREIAAGLLGIPYELLTGDFSQSTYSSFKGSSNQWQRRCEQVLWGIFVPACDRIWRWFLEAAVEFGALPAPNFAAQRRDYERVTWVPPGWPAIDELKEITGKAMAVRAGFTSRTRVIAELHGEAAEQIEAEINAENARADTDERVHDTDPRKVTQTGIAVTVATGDERPTSTEPAREPDDERPAARSGTHG